MKSCLAYRLCLLSLALLVAGTLGCGSDGAAPADLALDSSVDRGPTPEAGWPDQGPPADLPKGEAPGPADQGPDLPPQPDLGGFYQGTFPAKPSSGFRNAQLTLAGVQRKVVLYFPAGLPAKAPLVIVAHGTGGQAQDAIWGAAADALADSKKVLIAAPQARKMSTGDWDNHNAGDIYFETHPTLGLAQNPDLQLVAAIIAEARRAYDIDARRVYIVGYSNGAFFSLFAATQLPDRIAAFGSVAGGLVRCATTAACTFKSSGTSCAQLATKAGWCNCSGTEKPGPLPTAGLRPAAHITHAANDGTVSPYYSCDLADRATALGYDVNITIRASGGHDWPTSYLPNAWPFLSQHTLP